MAKHTPKTLVKSTPWGPQKSAVLWEIFCLVNERDMPSNNTIDRLVERTQGKWSREIIASAIDLLWSEDEGVLRVDEPRRGGIRGYWVPSSAKKFTIKQIEEFLVVKAPLRKEDDEDADDEEYDDEDEDDDEE